jgi:septum formation protein
MHTPASLPAMPAPTQPRLVLASSSLYRRELLSRLHIDFETHSPDIDESPQAGEGAAALALRLACAKAAAAARRFPNALIVGSDQVAMCGEHQLEKPGDHAEASRQLREMSGRSITFHTALCLLNAASGLRQTAVTPVTVAMRVLDDAAIGRYLAAEPAYDCAGSARIEAFGITLVEKISGDDPNALIGLPLIALCAMLRNEGFELP